MKKILIGLLFVVSGLLFGQQKPFAYWHSAWSNTSQLPANFIATGSTVDDNLTIDATIFYRTPVDFDSILVIAKVGSAPWNRFDGIEVYYGIDTAGVQGLEFPHASFVDQSTVYASIYLRSTDGKWSGAKIDTAFFGTVTELNAPTNFIASGTSSNSNSLTWNTVSGATGYEVWAQSDRYLAYKHKWTKIGTSGTNSYSHTGIADGFEWNYYVKAYNSTDTSSASLIRHSYPVRSSGQNRYVGGLGNGGTFSSSSPTSAMSLATLVTNMGSLVKGDTVFFFADSVFAPSSGGGSNGLIEPTGQVINGDSLAYIVFAKYGTGASPTISAANIANRHSIYTYSSLWQYVIFQDINFVRPIHIRASTGHNHHIQFRRIHLDALGMEGGLWFYVNPIDEPERSEWTFEGESRQYAIEIADCYLDNAGTDGLNFTGGLICARGDSILTYGHPLSLWIHGNQIYDSGEDNMDAQGNGIVIEDNITNDAIASGIKITPHYNGGSYNIVRGNIVGNTGGAGDLSLSNSRYLRCYSNTIQAFCLFGSQEWNPPSTQVPRHNFIFNNILNGIEYSYAFLGTHYTHRYGDTTVFNGDSLYKDIYYWHNIRGGGSYANIHQWYWNTSRTASWSSGVIDYSYSGGTAAQLEITSSNIASVWANKIPYIKKDTIVAANLFGAWEASDTRDSILYNATPLSSSYAVGNGYDTTFTDFPYVKDIKGDTIVGAKSIGAIHKAYSSESPGTVMSNPTFTATFGSNSSLRFEGTFDADTDTVRINGKRVSSPVNAYEDSTYLLRLSSGVLDTTITGSWYNDTTYYFRCSTIGDSSGTSVTTFALDTAVVPAVGGGGGGGIASANFENNTETGTDGFVSVVKTPHTSGTQSVIASDGTYAWEITGSGSSTNGVYGNLTFTDQGSTTLKFDMWLDVDWVGGDYTGTNLARIFGNGSELVLLGLQPASFSEGGYRFSISGTALDGETDLDENISGIDFTGIFEQWVTIELQWIKSTTVGGVVFKINDVTVYSELDKNTDSLFADEVRIGFWENGDNLGAVASRFDNIIVE